MPDGTVRRSTHRRSPHALYRRGVEQLESRVLFATTVFSDGFEGNFLTGWTNRTGSGANSVTRWGVNTVRAAAGNRSAFASAVQGGVSAAQGYQNNQHNTLVRENLSLSDYRFATLSFDYFLNSESGYDTFSVAVTEGASGNRRTTLFSESGNFAPAGWRTKTLDLGTLAGKRDLDLEFRFESDSSVTQEAGGVWIDEVKVVGNAAPPAGTISGKLYDDANNNQARDAGETPLANWRVYLDQNRNGSRDSGEASKLTDSGGNYSFTGLAPGTYYVAEEIPTGFVQTSPGAAGVSSGSSFKIDVVFPDNSLTAAQRAAFADAAARWSQIIVGDIPEVSDNGMVIDDIRISATAPSIDGRGGILGQAAPSGFRSGSNLPFKGFMEFDAQDLAQLETDGQLARVILHEMAHVLGFGTIWGIKGLLSGGGSDNPRYTGPGATAQYNSIFAASDGSTPVEGGGNGGTNDSHWRESVFGNELMTGYLNGGANPISRVTVGAMADLGYAVSYSAADAYTRPALLGSLAAAPASFVLAGPFAMPPRDVEFYGEMTEDPVAITASNTASAAVAAAAGDPTLLGFAHTVFIDAGATQAGIDFGNRRANTPPAVGSVSDSPDNITAGTNVTLTASGVSDPGGSVSKVSFYRESNGASGLQTGAGGDTLVGADTSSSGGFQTTFSTAGLAPAAYTYYAQATDNAGATSAAVSCTNTVKPSSSTPSTGGGTIAGTVFNDINGNGTKDAGEPGISGVRVYVDADKDGSFDSSERNVITGSNGAYSFTGLAPATYNVRQIDPSGYTRTTSSPVVPLAANAATSNRNFGNFKNASIAGRVFDDRDRDGVQDSGENGLANVRVYDDKNGNGRYDSGERNATTNLAGDYTLASLNAGVRTVRIVLPSGRSLTTPSAGYHRLTPTSGQSITGKRFGTRTGTAVRLVLDHELT